MTTIRIIKDEDYPSPRVQRFPSGGYDFHKTFKVMLIGASSVGKTSLLLRFSDDYYTESYIHTMGVDFKNIAMKIGKNKVRNQVFDIKELTHKLKGISIIILAFDLTDKASFDCLPIYIEHIQRYASENVTVVLVGTKSDQASKRAVTQQEIDAFTAKHQIPAYVETSAKTNKNVDTAFIVGSELAIDKLNIQKLAELKRSTPKAAQLIQDLEKYIARIEKHKTATTGAAGPDFSYGFWFFKKSRAINRQVNYLLAQNLLHDLRCNKSTQETFANINAKRVEVIRTHSFWDRPDYVSRGMNSSELQEIINSAQPNF